MSTKNMFQRLILCTLLCTLGSSFAQQTHVITMHVDTGRLNNGNPSLACSFSTDANTQVLDDSTPENFTILVNEEDEIIWEAITTSGDDIDIEGIEFEEVQGKKNLFNSAHLNGNRGNGSGKKAKGKVDKKTKGQEYKYAIQFTSGGQEYQIDPKIRVGT